MSILSLLRQVLQLLIIILKDIVGNPNTSQFGGKFMFIVKDNNPDVGFTTNFVVEDEEGVVLPDAATTMEIVSDNEDAVSITVDDTGKAGTVHFGAPGLANINATVLDANGALLGSFGAQFTVTAGDPAQIAGGAIVFDGLTEA